MAQDQDQVLRIPATEGETFTFHLVNRGDDVWQTYMEGHPAPLNDHIPLARALEVAGQLAAMRPGSSLHIHTKAPKRLYS